jgi:hypothetical protein
VLESSKATLEMVIQETGEPATLSASGAAATKQYPFTSAGDGACRGDNGAIDLSRLAYDVRMNCIARGFRSHRGGNDAFDIGNALFLALLQREDELEASAPEK